MSMILFLLSCYLWPCDSPNSFVKPFCDLSCVKDVIFSLSSFLSGPIVLCASVAMEELGSGKGFCPADGPQLGHNLRGGKEAQKEAAHRLHVLKPEAPQLLGVPVLLLRVAGANQHCRYYFSLQKLSFEVL